MVLFCLGSIVTKKKKTTASVTFFDGFAARNWRPAPFCWFKCKEGDSNNVVTFFYGGGDVKKAMATGDFFIFLLLVFIV
jgi:hypothetical protein